MAANCTAAFMVSRNRGQIRRPVS